VVCRELVCENVEDFDESKVGPVSEHPWQDESKMKRSDEPEERVSIVQGFM
jgi:hypothetical protein